MFKIDYPAFISTVRADERTSAAVAHLDDTQLTAVFKAGYREGWKAIGGVKPALARILWLIEVEGGVELDLLPKPAPKRVRKPRAKAAVAA